MTAVRLARSTAIVCLFAAAVEVASGCVSTAGLAPADAIIALFVAGPYLLLASLAWRLRARATASRALLAVAVGLAAWGLATFGWHGNRYRAEPHFKTWPCSPSRSCSGSRFSWSVWCRCWCGRTLASGRRAMPERSPITLAGAPSAKRRSRRERMAVHGIVLMESNK
jgi:hypothetical protein